MIFVCTCVVTAVIKQFSELRRAWLNFVTDKPILLLGCIAYNAHRQREEALS